MTTTATDESSSQNDEVKVKLAELERENYVLKEQLNESKLSVDRIIKENEALKAANQTLEKQALEKSNNYKNELADQDKTISSLQLRNVQLRRDLTDRIGVLEIQNVILQTENNAFRVQTNTLQEESNTLKLQNNVLAMQIYTLHLQNEGLRLQTWNIPRQDFSVNRLLKCVFVVFFSIFLTGLFNSSISRA